MSGTVAQDAMDTVDPALSARLDEAAARYGTLEGLAADPAQARDQRAYRELMQEYTQLAAVVRERDEIRSLAAQIEEAEELAAAEEDEAMRELAAEEGRGLRQRVAESVERARELLVPRDPNASRNIIMEIRAGTGGDEATLFTADLYRMYGRYADARRWKVEILSSSPTEIGGFRELSFSVAGTDVFDHLRWESGASCCGSSRTCSRRRRRRRWRSARRTSAWTSTARPARAGRASTPPTPPCA